MKQQKIIEFAVMWTRLPFFVVALFLGLIHCINGGSDSGSFISKDEQFVRSGTVKTFKTAYGDIVDCVDVYKQPAFDHPLLKNHVLQWKPVVAPKQLDIKPLHERSDTEPSSFVSNEVSCPINTIPIRRTSKKEFHATDINAEQNGRIYRFAILKLIHPKGENFHGALTYISLNNPKVDEGQNSGASIWIGSDLSNDKNFLKAGWMVYPEVYGDSQTRYSIYWTGDGYHNTGCYDIHCPGFVQVDRTIVLGSPFPNISTHGKKRFDQYFYVYQDPASQDWWLMTANDRHAQPVGYWPKEIVPRLRQGATILHFGGSTMTQSGRDFPMMGDGSFPDGNPLESSYFRLIRYANKTNDLISPQPSTAIVYTDNTRCYLLSYDENGSPEFQHALYFGGPGGQC